MATTKHADASPIPRMIVGGTFAAAVLLVLLAGVSAGIGAGVACAFLLGTLLIAQGLKRIPASPPHVALVTIFGERSKKVKREGWRFFPLYPFWYGAILVKVERVNINLSGIDAQTIRTPDLVDLSIDVQVTYTPEPDPSSLHAYIEAGGEQGVRDILTDIIRERLREWAIADPGGPANFEQALGASRDASAILLASIIGESNMGRSDAWNRKVEAARRGGATFGIPQLGIVLNRLNIGEIRVLGELAEIIKLKVKEERERVAEKVEFDHIADRLAELIAKEITVVGEDGTVTKKPGPGLTRDQALDLIQTERKKVTKTIEEKRHRVTLDKASRAIGGNLIKEYLRRRFSEEERKKR